jgi:dihydrofolate reductase
MTEIILVAAVGKSGQLGLNGGLPWGDDFKEDRIRFRDMTAGHLVIMGWKTYLSCVHLDGTYDRVFTADIPEIKPGLLIKKWEMSYPNRHIFIAGGAKTYERWLPHITLFDITVLNYNGPADTWMPNLFKGTV